MSGYGFAVATALMSTLVRLKPGGVKNSNVRVKEQGTAAPPQVTASSAEHAAGIRSGQERTGIGHGQRGNGCDARRGCRKKLFVGRPS